MMLNKINLCCARFSEVGRCYKMLGELGRTQKMILVEVLFN